MLNSNGGFVQDTLHRYYHYFGIIPHPHAYLSFFGGNNVWKALDGDIGTILRRLDVSARRMSFPPLTFQTSDSQTDLVPRT